MQINSPVAHSRKINTAVQKEPGQSCQESLLSPQVSFRPHTAHPREINSRSKGSHVRVEVYMYYLPPPQVSFGAL